MLDLLVPEGSENNNQHISENSAKNSLEESPSEKQRPLVKESSGPGTESSLAGLDKEDSYISKFIILCCSKCPKQQ